MRLFHWRPPLDLSRSIDLPCIPAADFTKPRLDWSQSKFDPTLFPYSKSQTVLQPNFSESVSWFWKIVDVDMSIDPCFVINNETDFVSIQQVVFQPIFSEAVGFRKLSMSICRLTLV